MCKIKKAITALALTIGLMAVFISPAIADSGLITGIKVNVRSGPNINLPVISTVDKNIRVEVLEKSNDWVKIKSDSLTGWIYESLINIDKIDIPTQVSKSADTGLITGIKVNVRSGPSINSPVVGSMDKDSRVEVLEQNNDWAKIKSDNLTGWVYKSLITINKEDIQLQVLESTVNLRSGPGLSYPKIGQAAPGDLLVLEDTDGEWYKVKTSDDTTAFVRSDLISEVGSQPSMSGDGTKTSNSSGSTDTKQDITVLLDNQSLTFEVLPVIENNRVLVPLRAIFEAMGAKVEWQQANNTAVAVKGDTTVIIPLNSVHPTVNGEQQTLDATAKVINQRILAPLRFVGEAFGGQVTWDQSSLTVKIQSPIEKDKDPVQIELPGLRLSKIIESSELKITMESDEPLKYSKSNRSNNLSYEFSDVKIEGKTSIDEVAGITAAATAQDNMVIVNIDIPVGLQYTTSTENNGLRQVVTIPNAITKVFWSTFGSGGEGIGINAISRFTYTADKNDTGIKLELNNLLPGTAETNYNFASELISNVTLAGKKDRPDTTVITIDTTIPVTFEVGTNSESSAVYILFIDKNARESSEPIVVLDPGHGGKDPGACGYVTEKNANLAIALKAGEFLSQNGIKVMYTRKDDTYLEISEIPYIANLYNADVFVSIHNNASESTSATGTETFYYAPQDKPELYLQKDKRCSLASQIQEHVVDAIKLPDRGVKTGSLANFAVLRNSKMPSALLEGAFVSNPIEGSLLNQASFQEQIGVAVAQAILEYISSSSKS